MITPDYARLLARYNRWQNESLYRAAGALPDADRRQERGAFFGSIHATLNHLLWADQVWMSRLAGTPTPAAASIAQSLGQYPNWDELTAERVRFDAVILDWADTLHPKDLEGELTWHSGAIGREVKKPRWQAVVQLFNHQTHHRGQVHCLLTQFGAKPEATDIPFMPE
jgi:uncharacterized damage-inducible protein DinB